MQNVLQYNGKFYVCGTGRQTLVRSKTSNDNYYLLTMAAIAQEIRYRRGERKAEVVLAAGLPLASFGREKKGFREYLFRKEQPLRFRYEDESYEIRIQDVKLFPQGYSALVLHPECVRDEPSVNNAYALSGIFVIPSQLNNIGRPPMKIASSQYFFLKNLIIPICSSFFHTSLQW